MRLVGLARAVQIPTRKSDELEIDRPAVRHLDGDAGRDADLHEVAADDGGAVVVEGKERQGEPEVAAHARYLGQVGDGRLGRRPLHRALYRGLLATRGDTRGDDQQRTGTIEHARPRN